MNATVIGWLRFPKFYSLNFDFILDKLVNVGNDRGALYVHQNEGWDEVTFKSAVSTRDRSRVDIKLIFVFVGLELMGMS